MTVNKSRASYLTLSLGASPAFKHDRRPGNNQYAGARAVVTLILMIQSLFGRPKFRHRTPVYSLTIFSSCSGMPSFRVTLRVSITSGASLSTRE